MNGIWMDETIGLDEIGEVDEFVLSEADQQMLDAMLTELCGKSDAGEFDGIAPGLELGRLLETTDLDGLNGHGLVEFVAAIQRQKAHLDALAFRATCELAYCPPGDEDSPPTRTELPGDQGSIGTKL